MPDSDPHEAAAAHDEDGSIEEHPDDGEMPSDVNVQAERQEPLGH